MKKKIYRIKINGEFQSMQSEFESEGVKLWVLQQVPVSPEKSGARDFYLRNQFAKLNDRITGLTFPVKQALVSNEELFSRVNVESRFFELIDATSSIFVEEGQLEVFSKRSHYRDEDHLTKWWVESFFGEPLENFLRVVQLEKKEF